MSATTPTIRLAANDSERSRNSIARRSAHYRSRLNGVLAIAALLAATAACADDRPNVLLVFADDLGRELLSAYGGTSWETPHLDRLSADGLTFETCYATPLCSPSRVMLMTSQYSFRGYETWGQIDRDADTFVRRLREVGYQTWACGKWHMSGWDESPPGITVAGFDRHASYDYAAMLAGSMRGEGNRYWGGTVIVDGERTVLPTYGPDFFAGWMVDRIEGRDAGRPFFAYVALDPMHRPFHPTPASLPDSGEVPGEWLGAVGDAENFGPMLSHADAVVGRLLDALKTAGVERETLVLFSSDNGTDNVHEAAAVRSDYRGRRVAGGKYFPTELGTSVPLVARWPGVVEAGTRTAALTDLTDIGTTLCELAGVDPPADADGKSLLPVLRGEARTHKPFVYTWGNFEQSSRRYKEPAAHAGRLTHALRGPRWKLYADGRLFDLDADPFEERPVLRTHADRAKKAFGSLNRRLDELRSSEPRKW